MIGPTIAFTANLDPGSSVHSRTFVRAVDAGIGWVRERHGIEVQPLWLDDRASADGAMTAARTIVDAGADAVVGHFASGAALAAYPIYETAKIPLFLPAATSSRLGGKPNVYRICDNDDDYCRWVAGALAEEYQQIFVCSDGSVHGDSVLARLRAHLPAPLVVADEKDAQAVFVAGMFRSVLPLLLRLMQEGGRQVLLGDDCQSPELCASLNGTRREVQVFGFSETSQSASASALRARLAKGGDTPPGVYFFETVAATEVAAQWTTRCARHASVETVLGAIRFGEDGENRPRRFRRYAVTQRGFREIGTGPNRA